MLILLIFIIPQFLSIFFGKDIKPFDDSIMNLETINISKEENSFYDLDKLNKLDNVDDVNINDLDINTFNEQETITLLEKNKLALGYFDNAVLKDKFQAPNTSETSVVSQKNVISMNNWRKVSRLSILKSFLLAKQGKIDEVFEESFKSIKLGNSIKNSQCDTITYLVGIAMMDQGINSINNIIKLYPEKYQITDKYINQLKQYNFDLNNSMIKTEYLIHKESWSEFDFNVFASLLESSDLNFNKHNNLSVLVAKYFFNNNFYYKPKITLKYHFDFYNNLMNKPKESCINTEKTRSKNELTNFNIFNLYFTENIIGRIFSSYYDIVNATLKKRCELQTKLNELIK